MVESIQCCPRIDRDLRKPPPAYCRFPGCSNPIGMTPSGPMPCASASHSPEGASTSARIRSCDGWIGQRLEIGAALSYPGRQHRVQASAGGRVGIHVGGHIHACIACRRDSARWPRTFCASSACPMPSDGKSRRATAPAARSPAPRQSPLSRRSPSERRWVT